MEHLPVALGRRLAELQALVSPPRLATARVSPTLRVAAASPVPPQTEMEETIAGVWQELVGAQAVSVEDNFFDVGAHSLFLVQLHRRLQETLGREFPVVALFEHPSIRSLARHLAQPAWRPGQGDGRFRDRAQRHQQALAEIRTRLKKD
jgi:acyl carrier protein